MKKLIAILLVTGLLPLIHPNETFGQCASNMGFESGNFTSWTTSTDSLFIQPLNRVYSKPGINQKVVAYGGTDMYLGTINKPHTSAGNYVARVGNRSLRAVADTVYRTYIVDSLSDKLTIYSIGVVELAHNYWGVPTVEAPGFGYEIYVNGYKLTCLKGSFFCGNVDQPPVWQIGQFKDSGGVRKSTAWAAETLNFACYVGDTIEVRLFTRDCILLGHYAYAYFDVVCGDTTKPTISQIMLNDIIEDDELTLYCETNTTLYLEPNTEICPILRQNVQWSPGSYINGSTNLDSVRLIGLDSVWIYAEAQFTNYCQTVDVRDSILVMVSNVDPHDNIPKMPRNFCDCLQDTLDFGTTTVTSVMDQNGNTLTLNNGQLILTPCDNFYEETFWKLPSAKIVTNGSRIGTVGWVAGNIEGAVGYDSILLTGRVRYVIDYSPSKAFFAGITTNNVNNNNDINHAIYYNGGNIRAYFNGSNLSNLGTYTGTVTVDFVTLSNRRVQIWINGVLSYSYGTGGQRANFPVFPDFSARSNDTNQIARTFVFGPTKNIKDFTRLYVPTPFKYYISYLDRCGVLTRDTISVIPGFETNMFSFDATVCGLEQVHLNVNSPNSIIDDILTTSNGDGSFSSNISTLVGDTSIVTYTPNVADFATRPVTVYITTISGRCIDEDTANFTFNEIPVADAGPDITTTNDSFLVGGTPPGLCVNCGSITYDWDNGSSMNDSTRGNPMVYKNLLNTTQLILMVRDPITGCFSLDTTNVYTSLDNNDIFMNSKCLPGNLLEFNWTMIPSLDNYKFGIEYSTDFGETWNIGGEILAGKTLENGQAVQYAITTRKIQQGNVMYRWYAANTAGEKISLVMVEADCQSGTKYNVYPNPFTNNIEINIEAGNLLKTNYTIRIYNQYGQLMVEKVVDSKNTSSSEQFYIGGLEKFNKGIYYVNIWNNHNKLYSTMIVKTE